MTENIVVRDKQQTNKQTNKLGFVTVSENDLRIYLAIAQTYSLLKTCLPGMEANYPWNDPELDSVYKTMLLSIRMVVLLSEY